MFNRERMSRAYEVVNKHFTEGSKEVLVTGRSEMDKLGHRNLSTGHLFLALMQKGLARGVLSRHKLDLDSVRAAVKELTIDDESLPALWPTPRAKMVISEAITQRIVDGAERASSLHLLRGLMSFEMQYRGEPHMTISKKLGLDPGVIFDQAKKLSLEEDGSPTDEDLHLAVLVFLNPAPKIIPQ